MVTKILSETGKINCIIVLVYECNYTNLSILYLIIFDVNDFVYIFFFIIILTRYMVFQALRLSRAIDYKYIIYCYIYYLFNQISLRIVLQIWNIICTNGTLIIAP